MSTQPTLTAVPERSDATTPASRRRSLVASTVGNVLEWYEWSAYAVFAPFIAAAMFDPDDPVSALLATLAVFAVGFLMRPLGGIVFGRVSDRAGRKFVLITTMLMMAGGSLVIGLMPTYATVGVWASVILLLARMAQGFAHGGESATANTYVAEIAPPHRRGLWGSIVFVAIFAGSVLAYTVGGAVSAVLDKDALTEWGWRIPFILGAFLALAALYLRKGMDESEVFHDKDDDAARVATPAQAAAPSPTPMSRKQIVRSILLVIAMTSGITASHYTWTSYASTYAITQRGMPASAAYWSSVAAQVIALLSLPFWGWLSDKIGRRPLIIGFAVLMILFQLPLTGMITSAPWTLLVAASLALLIVAIPGALLSSTLSESFPTRVRTQGIGFAYSVSVAVFGGSAPYLNAQLIEWDAGWMFSVYIMVLCACTAVAVWLMPETKSIDLKDA